MDKKSSLANALRKGKRGLFVYLIDDGRYLFQIS